jgi:hypothetical protein
MSTEQGLVEGWAFGRVSKTWHFIQGNGHSRCGRFSWLGALNRYIPFACAVCPECNAVNIERAFK